MLVLDFNLSEVFLLHGKLLHALLVLSLRIFESQALWLDIFVDLVILFKFDDPQAETLSGERRVRDSVRNEVVVAEELRLYLMHDVW